MLLIATLDLDTMININMRCIEMTTTLIIIMQNRLININMRCIEILSKTMTDMRNSD